jgi:hypothetical protein
MSLRTFGLFIGFSDDRRLEVLAWFGIAVFVFGIIIIVVGVSRRHRVAYDGDDAPVDQPGGNVLGEPQEGIKFRRRSPQAAVRYERARDRLPFGRSPFAGPFSTR